MEKIDKLIDKEASITSAWQNEYIKIVKNHYLKNGFTKKDELIKQINERMSKYGIEALKEGVKWLNSNLV